LSEQVPSDVREFMVTRRVARLATADSSGAPHVVPVCYAYDAGHIYSALDLKPKRVEGHRLKRVRNIAENSRVALVVDDYLEKWDELAYVLVRGRAHILEDGERRRSAEAMLRHKYPQYEGLLDEGCTVIDIVPDRVVWWGKGLGGGGSAGPG
jgi:PPOX class probable F420-dependent enzyme